MIQSAGTGLGDSLCLSPVCVCARAHVSTCTSMTVRFVGGERADTLAHICSRRSLFGPTGWRTREAPLVPSQRRGKGEDKEMEFVAVSGSMSLRYESAIVGIHSFVVTHEALSVPCVTQPSNDKSCTSRTSALAKFQKFLIQVRTAQTRHLERPLP